MLAHISIGSNLGDRHAIVLHAADEVCALSRLGRGRCSTPVESDPWGYDSTNRFVNIGVDIHTDLPPIALLHTLQEIERRTAGRFAPGTPNLHRNPDGSYRDRLIDIDLITYGDISLSTPELTLPHPRMMERPFVLGPMRELGHNI